jgi:protein-disulfide isomerase
MSLSWRGLRDWVLVLAVSIAVGVLAARFVGRAERGGEVQRASSPLPDVVVSLDGVATLGSRAATTVLMVFSDFECPFCGTFARQVGPDLIASYVNTGKVLLAFRHLPLEQVHPHALGAAKAAECSRIQGQFWRMHDRLFDGGARLDRASLFKIADGIELDPTQFAACINDESVEKRIRQDAAEAIGLGVRGTPTLLVGRIEPQGVRLTHRVSSALSRSAVGQVLDEVLEEASRPLIPAPR